MKFHVALVLGLTALLNVANADVSHLSKTQRTGYVANGNNQNSVNKYWWMNTDDTQFTPQKLQSNSNGCSRCAASSNTIHLKRHNTQQSHIQEYNNNNNINGHYITRRPYTQQQQQKSHQIQNIHKSAHIIGSPRDVNSYFSQQQSARLSQQSTPCTDSNSACVAPKFCYNGVIDQLVENKASRSTSGRCNAPEVCCRFGQRKSANFKVFALDSVASPAQSTSEVLTNEGYVVRKPTNTYLPVPEYNPASSNDVPNIIKPSTRPPPPPPPPTTRPPPPPRPLIPQPSNPIPSRPFIPAPTFTPVGCSAALNCTKIEMCSAIGVMTKSPVILTPEQELFRVPLSACLHPITKEPGVCCRDPDYTDPWPVGRTGQYVPEELNSVFDSGAYKPDTTNVDIVRVKPPSDGYVIPQPSNTQNRLYLPPRSNQI